MTKTSTLTKMVLVLFLVSFTASATASHESSSGVKDGFVIPDYESHYEIATELFAPFLLTTVIFQIILETTLRVTLMPENRSNSLINNSSERKRRKKKIKRVSLVSALSISGMLVPTQFYPLIVKTVTAVFGSLMIFSFLAVGIAVTVLLIAGLIF